jgi:hypothetical protein
MVRMAVAAWLLGASSNLIDSISNEKVGKPKGNLKRMYRFVECVIDAGSTLRELQSSSCVERPLGKVVC